MSITAIDTWGNTATAYTGNQTLTFSGPGTSPGGNAPSYPTGGVVAFTNGTATANVTLYNASTTTDLTATQGTLSDDTGTFTVSPGSRAGIGLADVTATPATTFACTGTIGLTTYTCTSANESAATAQTLTAQLQLIDAYGNAVTNTGNAAVSITLAATGNGTVTGFAIVYREEHVEFDHDVHAYTHDRDRHQDRDYDCEDQRHDGTQCKTDDWCLGQCFRQRTNRSTWLCRACSKRAVPRVAEGRGNGRNDTGATLILALLFLVVIGLLVGGLASWTANNLTDAVTFQNARSSELALNSATQLAIQNIRYQPLLNAGQTLNANPPSYCWGAGPTSQTPPTQGPTVEVWCSTTWDAAGSSITTPSGSAITSTREVTITACLTSVTTNVNTCVASPGPTDSRLVR